jgi:hypothetical protein
MSSTPLELLQMLHSHEKSTMLCSESPDQNNSEIAIDELSKDAALIQCVQSVVSGHFTPDVINRVIEKFGSRRSDYNVKSTGYNSLKIIFIIILYRNSIEHSISFNAMDNKSIFEFVHKFLENEIGFREFESCHEKKIIPRKTILDKSRYFINKFLDEVFPKGKQQPLVILSTLCYRYCL